MKHNREPQRGLLKQRPIFVLIRERAGTPSRTRINAPHDSEQTKSVKILNQRKVETGSVRPTGSRKPPALTPTLKLRSQHVDYVIGGNYAHQLILLIDDREHEQIVLIEQFGNCVVAHILKYPHKRYLSQ
jgi:hypothetical protein